MDAYVARRIMLVYALCDGAIDYHSFSERLAELQAADAPLFSSQSGHPRHSAGSFHPDAAGGGTP